MRSASVTGTEILYHLYSLVVIDNIPHAICGNDHELIVFVHDML